MPKSYCPGCQVRKHVHMVLHLPPTPPFREGVAMEGGRGVRPWGEGEHGNFATNKHQTIDRRTDRLTDRQTEIHTCIHTGLHAFTHTYMKT